MYQEQDSVLPYLFYLLKGVHRPLKQGNWDWLPQFRFLFVLVFWLLFFFPLFVFLVMFVSSFICSMFTICLYVFYLCMYISLYSSFFSCKYSHFAISYLKIKQNEQEFPVLHLISWTTARLFASCPLSSYVSARFDKLKFYF